MKFLNFLTSRGFAVFLLAVSIGLLVFRNKYPNLYSPIFLIIPACLFLSISLCTVNRITACKLKRDIRFWGSTTFHIGMLVIIAATSLGYLTRFFAVLDLPQGVSVELADKKFATVYEDRLHSGGRPFVNLKLNEFEAKYADELFPVEYIADITIGIIDKDGYRNLTDKIKINKPFNYDGYNILFETSGYSPRFMLKDREGRVMFNNYINLSNDTKSESLFYIKEADAMLYARFFPDVFREGNKVGSRSPVARNPAFGIRIAKRDNPFADVWKGVLKKGEAASFDGVTLEFADLKPYVVVKIVNDPAYWGIFAGWILIVGGLMVRYLPLEKVSKRKVNDARDADGGWKI